MSAHFPHAAFDVAVHALVDAKSIMFGFGPSMHHTEVPTELDGGTLFGSADAEHRFYALRGTAEQQLPRLRLANTPKNIFVIVASDFLTEFPYDQEVALWLAIAHALIVGVAEYEDLHKHRPVNMAQFVYEYMDYGSEVALCHHQ